MPSARLPTKRGIADSSTRANLQPDPRSSKKAKLDVPLAKFGRTPVKDANGAPGSSQPKSQFEEEVLEKLTQDITGLKEHNTERDQQWERPALDDFDAARHSLCFQQTAVEEGTLHGGRMVVRLFGVTEVSQCAAGSSALTMTGRLATR